MKDPVRITTATAVWKRFRRWFGRAEWAVWLLGLPRSAEPATDPGLILVQIDGLSRKQLERAMRDGRMPFLESLLHRENYRMHSCYSGLPSSTPAVQAELYYGKRTAVPAFGFRDHRTGSLVRMFAGETANEVEQRMAQDQRGLLAGGSSYANIYSGGADDVHFCATCFGWSEFLGTVNPLNMALVMVLNLWMFCRLVALLIVEFFRASLDFLRGVVSGEMFWQELIMIPARVMVVVLLRELVTIGTCFDAARGQPIIHLNLLGYDEQAHRRGPESRFAHWTLTGIDRSIRRIWNAAHHGAGRAYDVWLFSDHGQETTHPFQISHQQLIQEAVAGVVEDLVEGDSYPKVAAASKQHLPTRARWLGIGWLVSMLFGEQDHDIQNRSPHVQTVTSGPVGFVYLMDEQVRQHRTEIARRLVEEYDVPMVAWAGSEQVTHVLADGKLYQLPQDAVQVFGADHPFIEDVTGDLIRLVRHADAGDLVLIGWHPCRDSVSFVLQNGAHAGPGSDETHGFAMTPVDVSWPVTTRKHYLRPDDLRLAALNFLGRSTEVNQEYQQPVAVDQAKHSALARRPKVGTPGPADGRIRLLTWNVHACVGMDGLLSPRRIARVIAQSGADIVCLQELDVFRCRSLNQDQAHAIAQHLDMDFKFHHAWEVQEERFGNAILSRFPMEVIDARGLHHHKADRSRRSAMWAEVRIDDDVNLQVINTHLSIYRAEQKIQAAQLNSDWIIPALERGPLALCGDLNASPRSATCSVLEQMLRNVESFDRNRARPTLFSPWPISRVDHIFVSAHLNMIGVNVLQSRLAKGASDHLPLVCELLVEKQPAGPVASAHDAPSCAEAPHPPGK